MGTQPYSVGMTDLPRGVRVGYRLGSVATGASGTVLDLREALLVTFSDRLSRPVAP
jgi:hypothetical protein